jgi:hypothetical protein
MSKGWGKPNERKRRRTGEGETSDNSDDGISEILAAHGERFLRSFEDGPESGDTSEGDEPVKKQRKNGGNSGFSTNQG